jgi:hypothetical protein
MNIHDPDVVFTDLGLALLGVYFAFRLSRDKEATYLTRARVLLMAGLASAAFFGAVFHAFFPANTNTRAGFLAWVPVSLSIVLVASTLFALALPLLAQRMSRTVKWALVGSYAVSFAYAVLFVDESYATIVRFYAPTLVLFLIAASLQAWRTKERGWALIATSLALSIVAAVTQQARIALHPVYFDHNAVYHVIQAIALVVLYFGFLRVGRQAATTRAQ